MPTGFLNPTHNFTGETGYIIMQLVKSSAPLTEIDRVVYEAPHSQRTHLFEGLDEVWHLIRFWRSSDGEALDEEILTLAGNAKNGAMHSLTRYEYVVGRGNGQEGVWSDPEQDDTGIRDTRLLGKTFFVHERGTGDLLAAEIVVRDDDGGGFDFADDGKKFEDEGVYIVTVLNRTDADTVGSGSSGGGITGVIVLEEDDEFDAEEMSGKLLVAGFSNTVGTLSFQALNTLPDSTVEVQTHGGSQRNVVLQLESGDTVKFRGEDVNKIVLGQGEHIKLLIKDNVMYVLDYKTNHFRLGQRIWGDFVMLNTAIADGSEHDQADFPRVVQLMDMMPAGQVVSYTTWETSQVVDGVTTYPHKGKFARNNTTGKFRFPDMRSMSLKALSATDGSVAAGRYEHQEILAHYHFMATGGDGAGPYLSDNHGAGGNSSYNLNSSPVPPTDFRTSTTGGSQNIVNNQGFYPLICI